MAQQTDNVLETKIPEAIKTQVSSIVLPDGTSFEDVRKVIRIYMRQHPEIFWFSNQYEFDKSTSTLYLSYNFTVQKRNFFTQEINNAVKYLFQPEKLKHLSDLKKVSYVYKWIASNTTYNEYPSFNQTIYSVLINRNSVCTGYAKTAQYLLGLLGVDSQLVFGQFHSDKSKDGRHGRNIVKIDGEWYHVDFCLADPSLKYLLTPDELPVEHDGLLWNFFCKPTEYILKNRSIEFLESYPICEKTLDPEDTVVLNKPIIQLEDIWALGGRPGFAGGSESSVISESPDDEMNIVLCSSDEYYPSQMSDISEDMLDFEDSDNFAMTFDCMEVADDETEPTTAINPSLNNCLESHITSFIPSKSQCDPSHLDLKIISGTTAGYNPSTYEEVDSCIYAPAEVCLNKSFIIRVYAYRPEERDAIDAKVKEIDPSAVKKEYKPLDLPIKKGDKLTVQLNLSEGVQCKETIKSVVWHGHYTDCSFIAKLVDDQQDSIDGTAYILINDLPAGEMPFTIDVIEAQPRKLYAPVESRRYSKIFISYAHQDEIQVRDIAEGCRMLGKDYFFDRHSLHAGDIFKEKILNYIDNADLFVLCWSKNAATSEWVNIEREHALRLIQEGKETLSIYPLSIQPEAPLPIDMSDKYNFGTL